MSNPVRVGVIICDRYSTCAGGKCLRSIRERAGAFSEYEGREVELVGITTCAGCPGGNVEYAPEEMQKNNVDVIHLATCLLVGYPPCPYIDYFKTFITEKYGIPVVIGTHPIPEKYFTTHQTCGSWTGAEWPERLAATLGSEETRLAYN